MKLEEILEKYFHFTSFKPAQEVLIKKIITGNDVLAVLPTGFGKSLIYEVSGLYLNKTTIVVTPLISLMKDQVDSLKEKNIKATYINSLLDFSEQKKIYESFNDYSFIYVSPERLTNKLFLSHIRDVGLVVVDEAHTLLWGLEFRESMLNIKSFIKGLPKRPVVAAFTATANKEAIDFIIKALGLNKPYIKNYPPLKKNIKIETYKGNNDVLLDKLLQKLKDKKIIIYALTRKNVMTIYNRYKDKYKITYYHGGLDREAKVLNQDLFKENKVNILVGTNAFGMGVDLPDIRAVILYDIPLSLSDLIQEIGRAGRDNKKAKAFIILSNKSLNKAALLINSSKNVSENEKKLDDVLRFFYSSSKNEFVLNYFKRKKF